MRLVGDHREMLALAHRQIAHGVQGEGEGLDGADDDLLARRQRLGHRPNSTSVRFLSLVTPIGLCDCEPNK